MPSLLALKTFSACSTALFTKVLATQFVQGGKSYAAGGRPPEDKMGNFPKQSFGRNHDKSIEAEAIEEETRWRRIMQNDVECIPIGLLVFMGSILAEGHVMTNCSLMVLFTLSRIAHTYSYAHKMQPHRSITWGIAQLCVLASGLNGMVTLVL